MRNCYTKCIQTSDLIVFVRKQRCFCFVARARFFIFLFPNHRIIILLRKIRYFSVRIHSHATMATPAVSNICANFEEVGQVREQARAFHIQCFPLFSVCLCFSFSYNFDLPNNTRFSFLPFSLPLQAFAQHYYQQFDSDRSQLGPLYNETHSMLNFEHSTSRPGQFKGSQSIVEKLVSLPFQRVQHQVVTIDTQPTPNGGVLVFVCGNLLIDSETQPQKFAQTFQLMPTDAVGLPAGSYFIFNDVFRLNVG